MLTIFSTVFGFFAPFIPQVFKFFTDKADREHELALMKMRMEQGAAEHTWKLEEINAQADIAEMQTLRTPQVSFGVQLLDAAKGQGIAWNWLAAPFYLFAILDFLSGMVRPAITYGCVGFYMAVKYGIYLHLKTSTGQDWSQILPQIWGENDWSVLVLVLSYWFGARTAKAAFGGSAATGKPGGG